MSLLQQKCLQYWPDEDEKELSFEKITVRLVDVETFNDYIIRTLEISKVIFFKDFFNIWQICVYVSTSVKKRFDNNNIQN